MFMSKTVAAVALAAGLAAPAAMASEPYPTPVEGDFVVRQFTFETGATLPEVRIHYRTIGTPKRDASGVVRNAVLILHGTDGRRHAVPDADLRRRGVRRRPDSRRDALLHRPARQRRPRAVEQAERRDARALPAVHLRRHGAAAACAADRRPEGESPAPRARDVDGRDALLGVGRNVPGLRRRARAARRRADRRSPAATG